MIRSLIIIILVVVGVVLGIGTYLDPNSLSACGVAPSSKTGCQKVDAITAISGGDTNARADQAIALFKNGWADTIVFSGAAKDKNGPSNAAAMKSRAVAAGVPSADVLTEENGATTEENAMYSVKLFHENNIQSIVLVTSGYHQRRAYLEFHKAEPSLEILNKPASNDSDWSFWWWLTPRGWWLASSELVKIVAFYMGTS